jgi:hypothetical protein
VLAETGLIEEAGRVQGARGRPKTTYRPTARALFTDPAWSQLSPASKASISAEMFRILAGRVSDALQSGTFDSRVNRQLSFSTIAVDEEGWEEVAGLMASFFHRIPEIEKEAGERGEGRRLPLTIGLLSFESPRMYE